MTYRSPVRPALVAFALALTVFMGACSDEDSPTDPSLIPAPRATLRIDVSPDSTLFTGTLSGPDGFRTVTRGDTIMTNMATGPYLMVWPDIEGYNGPYPPNRIMTATEGDTITFTGIYTEIPPPPPEPIGVLFIGNSYLFYNDLPEIFRGLCAAAGKDVFVEASVPGGYSLRDHIFYSYTMGRIYSRDWDHVVLQGSGGTVAYPQLAGYNVMWALETLADRIYTNCADTEILFGMPWGYEDGFYTGGYSDDYFAMQQRIHDNTLAYPDEVDLVISPTGWAWNTIMLEEPEVHYLFHTDWYHPSPRGSYLAACVHFVSIFRQTVEGNDYHGGLNAVDATHFQFVASTVVLDDLEAWGLSK